MSGYKTVKSGDTTIGKGSFTADVTEYTTFTWSGTVTCGMNEYGSLKYHSGATNSASGTINLTVSPLATITYDANGGEDAPDPQVVCKTATSPLSATQPTRSGYTFSKWNTKADGTGTNYPAGSNIEVTEDTTLYAVWSTNEYPVNISAEEGVTITFDGDTFSNVNVAVNKPFGDTCAYSMTANDGYIIKDRDPETDGTMTIAATNPSLSATSQRVGCHLDDGVNWIQAVMFYDNGVSWDMIQAYYDNGVSWELVY